MWEHILAGVGRGRHDVAGPLGLVGVWQLCGGFPLIISEHLHAPRSTPVPKSLSEEEMVANGSR